MQLLLVEDNQRLRDGLKVGFSASTSVLVQYDCASGEEALDFCLEQSHIQEALPDVALMDVQLAGQMNGIGCAVALRREFPRFPIVFYSIQDDDNYYRDFLRAGILSHYAYVRKSNYLLPEMIIPLFNMALNGQSFIDPDIETRVQEVRHRDERNPLELLEPNELRVAQMLAQGLTNQQIADRLGYADKRTISRTNGQIYSVWGLDSSATDEKVARTRAALIIHLGRLIAWDADGVARVEDERGEWIEWTDGYSAG
ncbi:MAG: response regulator transcription factor [Chloroflexota bacterium]